MKNEVRNASSKTNDWSKMKKKLKKVLPTTALTAILLFSSGQKGQAQEQSLKNDLNKWQTTQNYSELDVNKHENDSTIYHMDEQDVILSNTEESTLGENPDIIPDTTQQIITAIKEAKTISIYPYAGMVSWIGVSAKDLTETGFINVRVGSWINIPITTWLDVSGYAALNQTNGESIWMTSLGLNFCPKQNTKISVGKVATPATVNHRPNPLSMDSQIETFSQSQVPAWALWLSVSHSFRKDGKEIATIWTALHQRNWALEYTLSWGYKGVKLSARKNQKQKNPNMILTIDYKGFHNDFVIGQEAISNAIAYAIKEDVLLFWEGIYNKNDKKITGWNLGLLKFWQKNGVDIYIWLECMIW